MHLIKKNIKINFNKAEMTYDVHCHTQNKTIKIMVGYLRKLECISYHNILDVGCGTGNSTFYVARCLKYNDLVGIDFAEKLLHRATTKCLINKTQVDIRFLLADFDALPFNKNTFDLIFSNMALQWSLNIKRTLRHIIKKLMKNRVFVFSIPLENTFVEINPNHRNHFYSYDSILLILEELGVNLIKARQITFRDRYETAIKALRAIKNVGANSVSHLPANKGVLGKSNVHKIISSVGDGFYSLSYQVGIFIIQKV